MSLRKVAAAFDAIAMVAFAVTVTGGSFADVRADVHLWGSAAAAVVAALIVLTNGPAEAGWIAIGYVLFAAFSAEPPVVLLIALAVAYMPILQRPRGSLLLGISLAAVTAVLIRLVAVRLT